MQVEHLLGPAYERLRKVAIGFDPNCGYRSSNYLVSKVKGELPHNIRNIGFDVRIRHRLRKLCIQAQRPRGTGPQ